MNITRRLFITVLAFSFIWIGLRPGKALTQDQARQVSNPKYRLVENWAALPEGAAWGPVSAVAADAIGNVHAFRRPDSGGKGSEIFTFDAKGLFIKSWGAGIARWAHSLRVDRDGFIWAGDGEGNTFKKFTPGGELLLTLGRDGITGEGPDTFNRPTDLAVAVNGDLYVSDGYGNSRVVKFSKDGKYIRSWGTKGNGPGQFSTPHNIVLDSRGRVFVADRGNKRIQIFDPDGNFIEQWTQFGAPYGMDITRDDLLFVGDGETNKVTIGNARDGKVIGGIEGATAVHWVSVDRKGNVYVASNRNQSVMKFARADD
jgi:hypothetical protein